MDLFRQSQHARGRLNSEFRQCGRNCTDYSFPLSGESIDGISKRCCQYHCEHIDRSLQLDRRNQPGRSRRDFRLFAWHNDLVMRTTRANLPIGVCHSIMQRTQQNLFGCGYAALGKDIGKRYERQHLQFRHCWSRKYSTTACAGDWEMRTSKDRRSYRNTIECCGEICKRARFKGIC